MFVQYATPDIKTLIGCREHIGKRKDELKDTFSILIEAPC